MNIVRWKNDSRNGMENELRKIFESEGYHCTTYTYPPGTVFPEHQHGVDKVDAVLAGRFRITIGDESVILNAGDYIYVPAGVNHRAEVVGDESVVSLDAAK